MNVDSLKCPYCGRNAIYTGADEVYGSFSPHRDLKMWVCHPCDAWVGCHKPNDRFGYDGSEPFGRLANAELRTAKMVAHEYFDPLWKKGGMSRKKAYAWLASEMGMDQDKCHIGMFDVGECERVVFAIKAYI